MPTRVRPGDDPTPEQEDEIRRVKRAVGIPGLDGDAAYTERVSRSIAVWQHRRGLTPSGVIDDETLAAADVAIVQRDTGVSIPEPVPPPWLTTPDSRLFAIRSTEWVRWQSAHRAVVQAADLAAWRAPAGGTGDPHIVAQCFASTIAGFDLADASRPHAYVGTLSALRSSAMARGSWHTVAADVRTGDLVAHGGVLYRVELPGPTHVGCLGIVEVTENVFEWIYQRIELAAASGFVRC